MKKSLLILSAALLALGAPLALMAQNANANPAATKLKVDASLDLTKPSDKEATLRKQVYALHQQAAYGDKQAAARLAEWKRQGIGEPNLYVNVAKIEKLAAERNSPIMWGQLGWAKVRGIGGLDPDVAGGLALMEKASAAGDNDATLNLGMVYHTAEYTPSLGVNPQKAKNYFQLLADRGDPRGHLELGWVYHLHDKDAARAAIAFEKAGQAGLAQGYLMAGINLRRQPAPQELRGLALLEQAAAMGDTQAAKQAGMIYFEGRNYMPRNLDKAVAYFDTVLKSADTKAQSSLLDSLDGPPKGKSGTAPGQAKKNESVATHPVDVDVWADHRKNALAEVTTKRAKGSKSDEFLTRLETLRKNREDTP